MDGEDVSSTDATSTEADAETSPKDSEQALQEAAPPIEYIFDFLPERRKADIIALNSNEGEAMCQ